MRKLAWFTLGFALACGLCAYLYRPALYLLIPAALLLAVLLLLGERWFHGLRIGAAVLVGLAAGLVWFAGYNGLYLQYARDLDGKQMEATLTAADYSYETDYGYALDATLTTQGRIFRVRVYLDKELDIHPGDQLTGQFRFRFTSLGGSKEPKYIRSDGIFLIADQKQTLKHTPAQKSSLLYLPKELHRAISLRIGSLFSGQEAAFAKALLLGDRSEINYETNTHLKLSGLSHVIAVSGLHVGILFALVYALTGKNRLLSCLIGIPVLFCFAAMVGFSPSITRACIMESLMLLAMLTKREYDPPTALSFAALAMLAANPMVIISISFQLSVASVGGIFLCSTRIHEGLLERMGGAKGRSLGSRLKRWLALTLSVTLSANLVTVPLVAYYFGTVSLLSVVTNCLVLWVIAPIFYGVMLAVGLSFLTPVLAGAAAWVVTWLIRYVLGVAGGIAAIPFAVGYTVSPYTVLWLILVYALLAVFACMKKKRVLPLLCCMLSSFCLLSLAAWAEPLTDDLRMTMLDVGQGQSILFQCDGKNILVDCGGTTDTGSADAAAEYLLSMGITRLDGIVVTHTDEDHIGGVPYLLTRISAGALFLPANGEYPEAPEEWGAPCYYVAEDTFLNFGAAEMRIIPSEIRNSSNDSGLCCLFQRENCAILITGDRSTLGEYLLLKHLELPKLDVLVAGHHGSGSSTGEALLEATQPQYAFISVGKNNYYGHPAAQTLERLEQWGCIILRTDVYGNILFRR